MSLPDPSGRDLGAAVAGKSSALVTRVTGALILISFVALTLCTERAINNGDWYRVTQFGGFFPQEWVPAESTYGFRNSPRVGHSTTMGIVVGALATSARLLSLPQFPTAIPVALAHIVFGIGLGLVAFRSTLPRRYLIALALLASYFCFGCYLTSFYEEASVLTLAPLLCYTYARMLDRGQCLPFALVAAAIIYSKIQMVIAVPVFAIAIWIGAKGRWSRPSVGGAFAVILLGSILAANSVHSQNKDPNSFNRYYNGLGWSLLDSWKWPAGEFKGRHTYFYENRQTLVPASTSLPYPELLGTSYWPTGLDMRRQATDDLGRTRYRSVVSEGRETTYLGHLARNPHVAYLVAMNTYLTTVISDYSTSYVRAEPIVPHSFSDLLRHLRAGALRYFGALCAAALLLWCIIQRRWIVMLIAACIAAIPMLVVMADGFFEFEKHMVPYLMLMPFAVTMALIPMPPLAAAAQRPQPETEQPIMASSRRVRGKGDRPESQGKRAGKRR